MKIIQIINFVSIVAQSTEMLSATPAVDDTSMVQLNYSDFDDSDFIHETTTYNKNIAVSSTATPYGSDIEQHRRKSKT